MRAKLAAAGDGRQLDALSPAALLDALRELLHREGVTAPPELERLHPLFLPRTWDALDGLEERDAERTARELDLATRFLSGSIPIIQKAEQRRERRVFAAGMSLLCSGAMAALIWSLTRPTNLALDRPVTSTAPGFETRADEAVNGVRFGEVGYHSASEESSWLQVDLETEHVVHRVQIYGRADCCFRQSIPMVVEGSTDGKTYFEMGLRDEPFRPFRPWVLAPKAASVRYVRVRTLRHAYLVVAELEVY
jgi:hypothetical protein